MRASAPSRKMAIDCCPLVTDRSEGLRVMAARTFSSPYCNCARARGLRRHIAYPARGACISQAAARPERIVNILRSFDTRVATRVVNYARDSWNTPSVDPAHWICRYLDRRNARRTTALYRLCNSSRSRDGCRKEPNVGHGRSVFEDGVFAVTGGLNLRRIPAPCELGVQSRWRC